MFRRVSPSDRIECDRRFELSNCLFQMIAGILFQVVTFLISHALSRWQFSIRMSPRHRSFRLTGVRTRRTIRCVLFADEEHRQSGARAYLAARQADTPSDAVGSGSDDAAAAKSGGTVEKHVAAIETGYYIFFVPNY